MKNGTSLSRAPDRPLAGAAAVRDPDAPRSPVLTRQVSGLFAAAVIGGTLAAVRLWAWVTRTPYHKD